MIESYFWLYCVLMMCAGSVIYSVCKLFLSLKIICFYRMDMTNCETCFHWKRYTMDDIISWHDEEDPLKVNPDDFGNCTAVEFAFWEEKGDKPFYVMDGSNYRAKLTTRRDFYCNQYSSNKPNN